MNVKHIVLFGAGKSSVALINYLKKLCTERKWRASVADNDIDNIQSKTGDHMYLHPACMDIQDKDSRQALILSADIIISLLPPALHHIIADDCIYLRKNLLTASYIDNYLRSREKDILQNGLLFLCEMGLDPGIDHMSAMELIDRIQIKGGTIKSFKSHCGGLVTPESDNNPWHYKVSWNPHNVVMAGKAGALYKENNIQVEKKYEELFANCNTVNIPELADYCYYPNRNSLSYIPLYGLENTDTFIRTTLRHKDFCFGWKNFIDLKLTDEEKVYDTGGLTISKFFLLHFEKHGFKLWFKDHITSRLNYAYEIIDNLIQIYEAEEEAINEGDIPDPNILLVNEKGKLDNVNVDEIRTKAALTIAEKVYEANLSMEQFLYLGLEDETEINLGICSAKDIIQFIIEKKLCLQPHDKDMVVILHELEYILEEKHCYCKSHMIVKGDDAIHTAMAKTVGLPLGIAAELILDGKINEPGLHIPIKSSIYKPVLEKLKMHDIYFKETYSDKQID